jgi:hypothetical protein
MMLGSERAYGLLADISCAQGNVLLRASMDIGRSAATPDDLPDLSLAEATTGSRQIQF